MRAAVHFTGSAQSLWLILHKEFHWDGHTKKECTRGTRNDSSPSLISLAQNSVRATMAPFHHHHHRLLPIVAPLFFLPCRSFHDLLPFDQMVVIQSYARNACKPNLLLDSPVARASVPQLLFFSFRPYVTSIGECIASFWCLVPHCFCQKFSGLVLTVYLLSFSTRFPLRPEISCDRWSACSAAAFKIFVLPLHLAPHDLGSGFQHHLYRFTKS